MDYPQDILKYNREAWNEQVANDNQWTRPVTSQQIEKARQGEWEIVLTPTKPVPRDWFPDFRTQETKVLCLASGGGQQGPILSAAGAEVTVFDNSEAQLKQDQMVAERDGLTIATVQGDMANLSCFQDDSFDLIFHPCSNCFVPDVNPVWKECFRVLRSGGNLLAGFTNPVRYLFDEQALEAGELEVKYTIPYSDTSSIDEALRTKYISENEPIAFGHTLSDQVAGQLNAGFQMTGFFEDRYSNKDRLSNHIDTFIATRVFKP